jgi:competence ComEA-like helix-hairpin-helix protein
MASSRSRALRFCVTGLLAAAAVTAVAAAPKPKPVAEAKPDKPNLKQPVSAQHKEPSATPAAALKVAKGFRVELLYSVPKDKQGSWVNLCVDPKGRLIASDQYGPLYRITPPPLPSPSLRGRGAGGEGVGAASTTKVEQLKVPVGGAHGLLWAFDSLYVMDNEAPKVHGVRTKNGLYRVRSKDGGDTFEKPEFLREVHGGGEHGAHAVLLGPDKKSLYVIVGDATQMMKPLDESRVPRLWGEDHLLPRMPDGNGFMAGVLGPGGCIYKVSPDGKHWELISTGYRNEFDAAFNREGELFTYDADMEWDMNTPWYRPTRVCLATSGSEYGWRNGAGKWPPYEPDSLPAIFDVGPGSPTGMCFGYGARFPAKYQDALFMCDWSYGKLYALHLKPQGSAYTGELEEFVSGSPLQLTDVVVNPKDGALYFTIGGRQTQSGLYRVTYAGTESTAPSKGEDGGKPASAAPPQVIKPLDINYASAEELRQLPGVGPKLAQRILAQRVRGRFKSVDDLRRVPGLGRKALERLRPFITVDTEPSRAASAAEARALRHRLEAFHGKHDPRAVDTAWPYLAHPDRFIRFAARVAVEHQGPRSWQDRALAERNPVTALGALLALVRATGQDPFHHPRKPGDPVPGAELKGPILYALDRIPWERLTDGQRLDLLRIYAILFNRMGPPDPGARQRLIARFDPRFPAKTRELNAELCQLLVYLEAPEVTTKALKLMAEAPTQEEQLEYGRALRVLKTGWAPWQRAEYFAWLRKAVHFKGGASLRGFINRMLDDSINSLSDAEKTELLRSTMRSLLSASAAAPPPTTSRPVVKAWTVDDLVPVLEAGLKKKRDFDRGRVLFGEAKCFSCHRFSNEGGAQAPDLTGAAGRFNVRDLLESIVEPSKEISDQYAAVVITLNNGQIVTGRIANHFGDTMAVMTNMLDPNGLTNVRTKDVESMQKSPVSMMPKGLLDTFKQDEICDLVAYVLSRGDRNEKMFQ